MRDIQKEANTFKSSQLGNEVRIGDGSRSSLVQGHSEVVLGIGELKSQDLVTPFYRCMESPFHRPSFNEDVLIDLSQEEYAGGTHRITCPCARAGGRSMPFHINIVLNHLAIDCPK